MRKLNRFTFHEGTADNPVVLSSTQITTLVKMINDEDFVCDFSGYVTSENGVFSKGECNQLEYGGFNVIYTTLTPDEFSVEPVNAEINEGGNTKLITSGVLSNLVKFEIASVSVKNNVLTSEEFKRRCSISEDGILSVAPAEENLDWEGEVNILAYPSYSTKAEGRSCIVKVNAIKISEIFFDSSVPELVDKTIPTTLIIKPYPANNTKTYSVVFTAQYGIIDGSYYSSNNNIEDTITATANILGNVLTATKEVVVDDVILNDVLKNPVVFASVKQALNLAEDVHEYKISDARKTTNSQVETILTTLSNNNNSNTGFVTFNELKYFNCSTINIAGSYYTGQSFTDLTEITFPDTLVQFNSFFVNTQITDFNFNNCKNKVNIGTGNTHSTCNFGSSRPVRLDLSNADTVLWGSDGNGTAYGKRVFSEFILGKNTKFKGLNGPITISNTELHIPNLSNISSSYYSNRDLSNAYEYSNGKCLWGSGSKVVNVKIDNEFNTVPGAVFNNLTELKTINGFAKIPDNVSKIEALAFCNCKGIAFTTLPKNLVTLEAWAFSGCISIPYMDLSECVLLFSNSKSFNGRVFYGCTSLSYIKLPSVGSVIPCTNISSLPAQVVMYVPDNLVDSYKSATNWNSIASRIYGYSEM